VDVRVGRFVLPLLIGVRFRERLVGGLGPLVVALRRPWLCDRVVLLEKICDDGFAFVTIGMRGRCIKLYLLPGYSKVIVVVRVHQDRIPRRWDVQAELSPRKRS